MSNEKIDCCFTDEKNWFRYRACAIIIENDAILMASNDAVSYYYSVGGGVHVGETSEDAVLREVYEETGIHYEIDRLAFIHENFFAGDGSLSGKICHEIAFYYLMKSKGNQKLNSNSICSEGKEYMNWVPINEIEKHVLFPSFFKDKLTSLSNKVEHIVTNEL